MTAPPISLDISADFEGLARLDDWIETATAGWSPDGLMKARVCAAELAANLYEHGSDPGAPARLTLRLSQEPDGVLIEMIDDGRPFDPTAALPAPERPDLAVATAGGRGLRAVHALAVRLNYRREDRRNRLQVLVAYG